MLCTNLHKSYDCLSETLLLSPSIFGVKTSPPSKFLVAPAVFRNYSEQMAAMGWQDGMYERQLGEFSV